MHRLKLIVVVQDYSLQLPPRVLRTLLKEYPVEFEKLYREMTELLEARNRREARERKERSKKEVEFQSTNGGSELFAPWDLDSEAKRTQVTYETVGGDRI